jgi:hypothetical protein
MHQAAPSVALMPMTGIMPTWKRSTTRKKSMARTRTAKSMVERTDNHHQRRKHRLAKIDRIRGCSCSLEHLDVDLVEFC